MSMKTTVGAVSAAFFGVVLSASAAGTFYDAELTNSWISASLVPGLSTAGGAAVSLNGKSGWTAPQDGEAMATNTTIVFDTEVTDPLVYTPASQSGNTALVNVNLLVEPNAAIPSSNGLESAQAALTVVTNSTNQRLDWVGLVGSGATNAWIVLTGDNPVQGDEYDVQIALDNRTVGEKKIRYAVKRQSAAAYTVLRNGDDEWFPNPKNASGVTAVAFAGAGTVGSFSGDTIVNDGASIGPITAGRGFDFTNGTLTAVFTIPSGDYTGKTAVLRVVNFADGNATEYEKAITGAGSLAWDLTSLTPGGTYSYTLSVKSGDSVRSVRAGSFVAANMSSACWFCAKVVNGVPAITNGTWTTAPVLDTDHWNVTSDALFEIDDISDGSNAVSRVDTVYSFQSSIDIESLDNLDEDAIGGLVAVSDNGGAWCAYTSEGWQLLDGGVVPAVASEYIVRAEFDFLSNTKRVRYSVALNNGPDLMPLSLSGNEWIDLAKQDTGALLSVGMSGTGSVKSICANIADKAVVKDSTDKKFATIWDAIQNGTGPFTLLTNATLAPTGVTGKKTFTIDKATFQMIIDKAGLGKWRLIPNGENGYILMKPGATYIFL